MGSKKNNVSLNQIYLLWVCGWKRSSGIRESKSPNESWEIERSEKWMFFLKEQTLLVLLDLLDQITSLSSLLILSWPTQKRRLEYQ